MAQSTVEHKSSLFNLDRRDVQRLAESEGFVLLRQYLAEHCTQRRCSSHNSASRNTAQNWLLSRDILHALLVPIVELFNKAVSIAERTTRATNSEDLEYAFRGNARFAFVWLQSFLERERKWCLTNGCAACVVEHTLDSEFSIRLLFAACYLSDIDCPSANDTPTLPSFGFLSQYLIEALQTDDLWSEGYIDQVQGKAEQLKEGLESLIEQTAALDGVLSAVAMSEEERELNQLCGSSVRIMRRSDTPRTRIKRGNIAKRQRALERERAWWVEQHYLVEDQRTIAQARTVPVAS